MIRIVALALALGMLSSAAEPQVEGRAVVPGTYLLRDNGMRCIQAPCYSIDVLDPQTCEVATTVASYDLSRLALDPGGSEKLIAELAGGRLLVTGATFRAIGFGRPTPGRPTVFRIERVDGPYDGPCGA